jgi:hypothetical protein
VQDVESISAAPPSTTWQPPFQISIAASKEEAVEAWENREQERGELWVFSDGSGVEGKVGAAAVALVGEEVKETRRMHLGSLTDHTVYEAECVGVLLALDIIKSTASRHTQAARIFLDNQAVIRSLGKGTYPHEHEIRAMQA